MGELENRWGGVRNYEEVRVSKFSWKLSTWITTVQRRSWSGRADAQAVHSLIRIFAGHSWDGQRRVWSACAHAQADLSLHRMHMQYCRKCCVQLNYFGYCPHNAAFHDCWTIKWLTYMRRWRYLIIVEISNFRILNIYNKYTSYTTQLSVCN